MSKKKSEKQVVENQESNNIYNRIVFLSALQKVQPALSSKNIIEETQNFIFTGDNLITNNDQISICYPLKTNFKCMVPANEIYSILDSMRSDFLYIEYNNEKLIFKEKDIKNSINAELITKDITDVAKEFIDMIDIKKFNKSDFKTITSELIEAMNFCLFSTSKEKDGSILTCVSINNDNVISSDDYRISLFTLSNNIKDNFLIVSKAISELSKFTISGYFRTDNWIYFLTDDDVVFCSRILSEEFPDVKQEFEFESETIVLPDDFVDMVKNASILADGEFDIDKKIEVKISENKVSCKGQNELGWIESKTDIDTKESFNFSINPNFLLQILSKTKNMKLGEGRIMFESENFKHLIALYND